MQLSIQSSHLTQRVRAELKVVVAAWLVGMMVWSSGVAGLALFF